MCVYFDRRSTDRYLRAMLRTGIVWLILAAFPAVGIAQETGGTAPITVVRGKAGVGLADLENACSDNPDEIILDAVGDLTLADQYRAYAFWTNENGDCTGTIPSGDDRIANKDLTPDVTTGFTLRFPNDFDVTFDQADVVNAVAAEACTATVAESTLRNLCLVIDETFQGDTDSEKITAADTRTGLGGEFYGWITFEIDFEAPPAPDPPVVTEMDLSLAITGAISATTSESDDVTVYSVIYREQPASGAAVTCEDIDSDTSDKKKTVDVPAVDDELEAVLEGLVNGTTYEICIRAEDNVGNEGPWSPVVTGTPIDECDFIECFPGGAPIGYCAAGSAPAAGLFCLSLLAFFRRRS